MSEADGPKTEARRAEQLARWERWWTPVVVVAAILPFAGVFSADSDAGIGPLAELACWLVFLVDLGVRMYLERGYLRSRAGKIDLAIVLVTFPFYLVVPALEQTDVLVLARIARLARIVYVGAQRAHGLNRLFSRLGATAAYAAAATLLAALIVNHTESDADGFDSFSDSLWWAIVTITTVGYGDLVPQTAPGRFTAALLMVCGITFLGALAASLASFFGLEAEDPDEEVARDEQAGSDALGTQVRELTAEVVRLREQLNRSGS